MSAHTRSPLTKNRKRADQVRSEWLDRFGLIITSRDPASSAVSVITCRFCLTFGRESHRVNSVKSFRKPFRTDNFQRHLRDQHSQQWSRYQLCSGTRERSSFFDVEVPYAETITSHFGEISDGFTRQVASQIFETILPLFNVKDCFENRLPKFIKRNPADEGYSVHIKKGKLFRIVVDQVSIGLSFREVTLSLRMFRTGGALGFLDGVTEQDVSKYVQTLTVLNLEALRKILCSSSVWCYAIAVDAATNRGLSYLDVRVRLIHNGKLANYHLLSIPFNDSHTGENMCSLVKSVLEVVAGDNWNGKLLAVTSDGASNMVGRYKGFATLMEREFPYPVFRVWCGAHQLDLIVQNCLAKSLYDPFYKPLTSLISYLRRQQRFSNEVGAQCPTVATTRWLSLGKVVRWILRNRVEILDYIERDDTAQYPKPTALWWLYFHAVEALMESVDICCKAIQGKDTLVVEHTDRLSRLQSDIEGLFGLSRASGVDLLSATALGTVLHTESGILATSDGASNFFENCGSFATACLNSLTPQQVSSLFVTWGKTTVQFVVQLEALCAERSSANAPISRLPPPVLPYQITQIQLRTFIDVVNMQRDRLLLSWTSTDIDGIEDDMGRFHRSFRRGDIPPQCLKPFYSGGCAMEKGWAMLSADYPFLSRFCFGLATIFPGTATVEADFSVINREASADRARLTGLSLKGILFAKQWKELCKIGT